MPNIVFTSYCNLHCPYCFANTMINTEKEKNITIKQYNQILNWINKKKTKHTRIGIIGGEPTLHPQIGELLKITKNFCQKNKLSTILFTNGIYIDKIINELNWDINILININTPKAMTKEQYKILNTNLELVNSLNWLSNNKVKLGCNICQEINDYSFFWNIIDKFNITNIRLSVVAPTTNLALSNKNNYYQSLKEKYLDFLYETKIRQIKIGYDCNQIPICYFNKKELSLIEELNEESEKHQSLCIPVIDITPDFKATTCFGVYDLVDCSNFNNLEELNNYLLYKKNVPLALANTQGKCATCKEHELLKCQGGCLAFAQYNNKEE